MPLRDIIVSLFRVLDGYWCVPIQRAGEPFETAVRAHEGSRSSGLMGSFVISPKVRQHVLGSAETLKRSITLSELERESHIVASPATVERGRPPLAPGSRKRSRRASPPFGFHP